MRITLLCMGKTDDLEIVRLIEKYEKRLPRHFNYMRVELPDIKNRKNLNEAQQKMEEEKLFLSKLSPADCVVLLDERGKEYSSKKFAQWIDTQIMAAVGHLVFVVGGPYGFSQNMYQRANASLSLSKLTFTHQMVRLFFTEQIYRAYTILEGKNYHHD
ncbi:23S rRNA (pseudouridine(1915)-N(3))-methyltransferase RlmH [Ornithobacterium rhinotracheale]|uniref:Ribosomal RNA large subunit methyltransferase H n=1 Tax=Ornithobacterium rhinotracheale TaxID=28251 RepID=A0A410JS29_ORNRH|nr:23S rRNA (pseudouridine(1915)-N(3))-methyltransferase RlmH [Ornithobacterium rhinotracheale]QAR30808.1 23S rRNA (pseudouridine(1915)-N(3))-methyltransferase RlmH [Ornithobacterium rhinotracheale]